MTDEAAAGAFSAKIADAARRMQQEHSSVEMTLRSITTAALETVPGVEQAGITLVTGRYEIESRAATSETPRKLDDIQQELREGPCVQSAWEHETVYAEDLAQTTPWPRFAEAAVKLGVRSMLSFQLFTFGENLGALNLYAQSPGASALTPMTLDWRWPRTPRSCWWRRSVSRNGPQPLRRATSLVRPREC